MPANPVSPSRKWDLCIWSTVAPPLAYDKD
jgi:hypothetical protein